MGGEDNSSLKISKRTLLLKLLVVMVLLVTNVSFGQIYKWTDKDGKVNFSDSPPKEEPASEIKLNHLNLIDASGEESAATSDPVEPVIIKKDNFRMPFRVSKVPYRFVLTSSMNVNQPVDRLSSIDIDMGQRNFYAYVRLIGVDSNKEYTIRLRIIDAKGELIFDKDKSITTATSSIYFVARIVPNINIDAPGTWTFQGLVNGEKLFVEKRRINFQGTAGSIAGGHDR